MTRLVVLYTLKPAGLKKVLAWIGPIAPLGLLYTIIVLFASQVSRRGLLLLLFIDPVKREGASSTTLAQFFGYVSRTRTSQVLASNFDIIARLVLYFTVVWSVTFFSFWKLSRSSYGHRLGGYEMAATQAFTAGSNNVCIMFTPIIKAKSRLQFELAIAVAIASFGPESPEVLAATCVLSNFCLAFLTQRFFRLGPLIEVPVLLSLSYVALWLRQRLRWRAKDDIVKV